MHLTHGLDEKMKAKCKLCGRNDEALMSYGKGKLYYAEYSLMFSDDDGVYNYSGHIYAEDKIDAQQLINQIVEDSGAIDSFTDVIRVAKPCDCRDD